jgi:hypothetical protein
LTKSAFLSAFKRPSTVPEGNFSNAALVGANTVKGPALLKASTKPPALTAVTKVVWSLLPTATCTILGVEVSSLTLDCPTPSVAALTSKLSLGAAVSAVLDLHATIAIIKIKIKV